MFIATRNQIDKKEFGGGYVNNFSTEEYSNYIKKRKINIYIFAEIILDHFKDSEKKLAFMKA